MHQKYNLSQNARGVWEIRWRAPDENGQPRSQRHSTRATDLPTAQAYLRAFARERSAALVELTEPTIESLIEAYLDNANERGVRSSQAYNLAPIRRALGGFQVRDLDDATLTTYRRSRLSQLSSGSVRRQLGALRAVLNWAAKTGKIKRVEIPHIELPQDSQPRELWLNERQEEEFHARALAWPLKRVGLYVAIGLNTGARKEAIHELEWSRVDLGAGLIDFRRPGQRVTRKRRVATPINDRLRAVLEGVPENERWGRVVGNADIRGCLQTFRRSTPWPWVTSHVFRHTFITLSLRAGMPVWTVAQMVGDTPEMIGRHYGHHEADWHLKEAANLRFRKTP